MIDIRRYHLDMVTVAQDLLETAMQLNERERLELAKQLISSVDDPVDHKAWDSAWAEELSSRLDAMKTGEVEPLEWSQIRARALAHLRPQS